MTCSINIRSDEYDDDNNDFGEYCIYDSNNYTQ